MLVRRESEMWEWAYRLAASGRFTNTDAVVKELLARGFEQTGQVSDSKYARDQIDNMCRKARQAKGKAGR
jgi:hypothetical protein